MAEELAFKDAAAAEYDRAFGHVTAYFMPFLLRAANIAPGMHVLDIATGTGLSAEAALAAAGPTGHVVAADRAVWRSNLPRSTKQNTAGSNVMDFLRHLPSPIAPSFSEALRIDTQAGCWIFISGQVGVPLPPDKGSVTFEQEVRATFERIRDLLSKLGAGMNHVVSIKYDYA